MTKIYEEKCFEYNIEIYQDTDSESPNEWGDENLFLVGYHRDFCVENKFITKDEAIKSFKSGKKSYKGYWIFGLEAYIHSGVVLALSNEGNFCDRRWDVSQLGLCFASKKEFSTEKKAIKAVLGLIKTWNDYLSGNVYGYKVLYNDEEIDSCWGYYGDYDSEYGALSEARKYVNSFVEKNLDHKGQYLLTI